MGTTRSEILRARSQELHADRAIAARLNALSCNEHSPVEPDPLASTMEALRAEAAEFKIPLDQYAAILVMIDREAARVS